MRYLDFHFHCSVDTPEAVAETVRTAKENNTVVALIGGLHYGGHDYVPNEQVLEICRKEPEWLVPLAKFDLWKTADADQVYRYKEAGFKAVKFIYPYYAYDHDLYMPVYEACEKCELPVLFHTGNFRPGEADVKYQLPTLKNMHPINLDRIARSFPKLHVVMAHLGTTLFRELAAGLVRMLPNLCFDLAGNGAWSGVSPQQLGELMKPFPASFRGNDDFRYFRQMVFGSDSYVHYPQLLPMAKAAYEEKLRLNNVPQDIQEGIMGKTVADWIGFDL